MDNIASILNSIKKLHGGIAEEDTSFDTDLIIHINTALMILNQLGAGPDEGFYIQDSTSTWADYESNNFIAEAIKAFVYVKVRLVFDPPASGTMVEALKSASTEYEWRIVAWIEQHKS